MTPRALGALVALAAAAAGCGLKGPLYLPEKSEVTIRPAPAATAAEPEAEPAPAEPQPAPQDPQPPAVPPPEPARTGPDRG